MIQATARLKIGRTVAQPHACAPAEDSLIYVTAIG